MAISFGCPNNFSFVSQNRSPFYTKPMEKVSLKGILGEILKVREQSLKGSPNMLYFHNHIQLHAFNLEIFRVTLCRCESCM